MTPAVSMQHESLGGCQGGLHVGDIQFDAVARVRRICAAALELVDAMRLASSLPLYEQVLYYIADFGLHLRTVK